jgi:hypothetical protein
MVSLLITGSNASAAYGSTINSNFSISLSFKSFRCEDSHFSVIFQIKHIKNPSNSWGHCPNVRWMMADE